MKRILFSSAFTSLFYLVAAVSVYSQSISNDFLFIEGTAEKPDHLEFFMTNFKIEAAGSGYTVTNSKNQAAFTFKFVISPNIVVDSAGNWVYAPPNDNQYVMKVSLIKNSNNEEILTFDFFYTNLTEMYEYTQFIFQRAAVYIPPASKSSVVEVEKIVEVEKEVEVIVEGEIDRKWQNKWIYLKISADYPISFFMLQPTGLFAKKAVYALGADNKPGEINVLDHKIKPQPGFTAGVEVQLLNFMSLGLDFLLHLGDISTNKFVNLAGTASLLFNIKTKYFNLQPYGAFLYPFNVSDDFKEFPKFAVGGGIQAGVRGGKNGSIFLNVNFLYYLGDVYRHNPFMKLYPIPAVIHYKLFTLGVGIGYKYGFVDRKPYEKKPSRRKAAASEEVQTEEEIIE